MALFHWLSHLRQNRRFKSYEKMGRVLMNAHTTKDQRTEAIDALAKGKGEEVIPQLMKRFELVIDHGLQDQKEKEKVLEIIKGFEGSGKQFAVESLKRARRITWFMKWCRHTMDEAEYTELLVSLLDGDASSFDDMALEKNREILLNLKEFPNPALLPVIEPFIAHRDNDIQMAALECLEGLATHLPEARQRLKQLAAVEMNDDNSRFLGQVQAILKQHGNWQGETP